MIKKLTLLASLAVSLSVHATPVVNLFELGVAQGANAKYDEVARHNIHTSITTETGTLAMYSVKSREQDNLAYMFEIYADEQAYQSHIASPQYRHFMDNAPQILGEHKQKIALTPVFLGDKPFRQTRHTLTNLVVVDVKPEHHQAFAQVVVPTMTQSLAQEKDVLAMYAATSVDMPNRWYFFEIYANQRAYDKHRATAHFGRYLAKTADMVSDKHMIAISPSVLGSQGRTWFDALYHQPTP